MHFLTLILLAGATLAPASVQPVEVSVAEHRAAQTDFPERVGEFRRGRVIRYDADGLDMSAGYDLERPEGRLTVTVYIYPARQAGADSAAGREAACRSEFDEASDYIGQTYAQSRRMPAVSAPAVQGTAPELSHRSVFTFRASFDDKEQVLRSELDLYCYVGDRWFVKYRATGPESLPTDEAMDLFIRNGPWPGRPSPESIAGSRPATVSVLGR